MGIEITIRIRITIKVYWRTACLCVTARRQGMSALRSPHFVPFLSRRRPSAKVDVPYSLLIPVLLPLGEGGA